MIPLYVRVLYSAIQAHGDIYIADAADLIASAENIHLSRAKPMVTLCTSPRFETNVLKLVDNHVCIAKPCEEVKGDEHLPWDRYIKAFNTRKYR